ncbi:PPC domain-containing protein [Haloferula rosea]|uniref:PPC domain-containing protein n=1 Tax=Haloferula rosea TaxID=490093 RepID=A0A934R9A4_9BACT|nr:PPC domain-containing protein [Haloferula rosea]MBK1826270.1 PPC domain-containing protein [Haloferula rosea]
MRPQLILLLTGLLTLAASASFSPKLDVILPRGAQRGQELQLHLVGQRLDKPQELLLHRPGIEMLGFEQKDKRLLAKVRIAPDAPLGEHPIRLRTTGGVSYLRSIWIGQFPTVQEAEPNDTFDTPQKIQLGSTVQGVSKVEDEDFYSVTLKKGQTLSVEVEAMRLARRFFDVYVAILDPKRFELAACDDATLVRTDAFASIVAPEDGEYRILVREAAYEGHDANQYRLHVGSFPRPSAVFPPAAKPGETIDLRFIGDATGDLTRKVTLPADASGLFPVFAERDGLSSPSPNWIHVSPLESINESEPNGTHKEANPMPPIPGAAHGILAEPDDTDTYRFTAKKDQNLEIRVLGRELRSPIDSTLILREAKGKGLANNDDQDGPDSILKWKCPADGDYLLSVRDKLGRGGPDFTYRLEILTRQPAITATLPLAERNNSQAQKMICIPRGGRYATAINITRTNLGCDARFEALTLPQGVTMHTPPSIPRATSNFPVIFQAAPDAPIAGGYHAFRIHATGDKAPELSGPLEEAIHLVEINNQGPYHSVFSEKIAVAVIDQAPFTLEVESPVAPIVPKGVKKLKVRVKRKEGFDAPITLRLPWKPPGIGAPDTIKIEAKKNEAEYELNANGDIQPGDWKLVVQGQANAKEGPLFVSSAFVPLTIAEPYLTASIDLGATEQGQDVAVLCKLETNQKFSGKAKAELIGLPHGTSTQVLEFSHDTKQLTFPVTVAKDAAVGKHSGLFLRIHIPYQSDTILHQCAQGGTLRIDKPRPAVAKAKPKSDAPPTADKPAKEAPKKPLSRLEQLRQQAKAKASQ